MPPLHRPFIEPRDTIEAACHRTLWSIIWSCLLTLFACTWVAIHPNAACERDSGKIIVARRVGFMLCMLIVPEMVICWALAQWILATHYGNKFETNDSGIKWTRTHAFFLIMGGFSYLAADGNLEILTAERLVELHREGVIQWPKVTLKQIQDRSKADFLSKFIVVVQTSWFSLQLIVRLAKGLSTTELEISTFAFAVLNLVVYVLWWEKPFDVRSPILVAGRSIASEDRDTASTEMGFGAELQHTYDGYVSLTDFGRSPRILYPLHLLVTVLMVQFMTIIVDQNLGESVPTLPHLQEGKKSAVGRWYTRLFSLESRLTVVAVIGSVFGALHLIAWNFPFHTEPRMWLWRASSLTLTIIPIVVQVMSIYHDYTHPDWAKFMLRTIARSLIYLYPIARITLIVLPIISLRHPASGVFVNINWTSLLPHF